MGDEKCLSYTWKPVDADMLPEPENCPTAIFEYYNGLKSDTEHSVDIKSNVRKHLLFLKWSIEYKSQENFPNKYRYISPDRSMTYYSLKVLCTDLIESAQLGSYSIQQPPSQVEEPSLMSQEDHQTWNSTFSETLPHTSMLTGFDEFMQSSIQTPSPTPKEGLECNLSSYPLTEKPVVHEELANGQTCNNLSDYPLIEQPVAQEELTEGQNCNLPTSPLFLSPVVEPQVYGYLKTSTMGPLNSNPQEESLMKTLSPITQDGDLSAVPSGQLIEEKPKSKSRSRNQLLACDFADIESECGPQAVLEYSNLGWIATRNRKDDKLKDLRMKVKQQMFAVGWEILYINKGNRRELRYVSPSSGKTFFSLITACKAYLHEKDKYDQIQHTEETRKMSLNSPTPHQDSSYLPLTYPFADNTRVRKRARSSLLPTRASPPVVSSVMEMGRPPRLRWVISDAEGCVSTDGMIMYNFCQEDMNLGNFETHARRTNHRPGANIIFKDGRLLQDCHLLLKSEEKQSKLILKRGKSNVKATQKHKKAKKGYCDQRSKGYRDQRWKRYRCSMCNKWGALVLCYQCTSKFHTGCLGLSEVPSGDWFCQACEDEPINESEFCLQAIVDYFLKGNILTRADDNNKELKDLRSKAKKHLCSIGWSFTQVDRGNKKELQYKSPHGINYVSLAAACEAYIFEDGNKKVLDLLV